MNKDIHNLVANIPGWLTPHEGKFLIAAAKYAAPIKGHIVEIGSYLGKSTLCLASGKSHVYAIDPHKGDVSGGKALPTLKGFRKNISDAGFNSRITQIVKTSKQAAVPWKKPISLLFIDGLHDFDHASEDFSLWSPHVVNGGIIAMHDAFCGWEGAGRVAMRDIVYSPDFNEIGVVGSIIYGIKGCSTMLKSIQKVFKQTIIELCSSIYNMKFIPRWVQFILVHKFLRIFLINKFSSL